MNNKKLKVTELNRLSIEEFNKTPKSGLAIVLDNVRSLHNVGSVFRTADAYLTDQILLCGITATPPNAEIHKTALGAENSVEWSYHPYTLDAVKTLQEEGYKVYAIEQAHGSTMLTDFEVSEGEKIAVVLGNEVKGVQQEVINLCDGCIELPQFGTKHSLNVSITAGIVIWELSQKLLATLLQK